MFSHSNSFEEGLNVDISDMLMRQNMMRNCMNMRLIDLDGTSYALTSIRGTTKSFTLTDGYIPLASREYGGILYIISGTLNGTLVESVEIGSFPSPDYDNDGDGKWKYRPFNNYNDGPFRVEGLFNLTKDMFIDMSIQPEYDSSVNIIITALNNTPRIINSKFDKDLVVIADRGGATSNSYTTDSVDTETQLIIRSKKIMNVAYGGIEPGGNLQAGNYVYIFKYTTDDFNESDIVNQSGICSVFSGSTTNQFVGEYNVQTTKRVRLTLSNIDTNFAYLKVYFRFSRGDDSKLVNFYEFTQPIAINGRTTIELIHDGYESTAEVSPDTINLDYSVFDNVAVNTQANGHLIVGNVSETGIDYSEFAEAAQAITMSYIFKTIASASPYSDPANIYSFLSYFSCETYPFGVVWILPDGSLTPVFPVQGYDAYRWAQLTTEQQDDIKAKGLFRFPSIEQVQPYVDIVDQAAIFPKGIRFDVSLLPPAIKQKTIGCFFVRGERVKDAITQGFLIPTFRVPAIDATRTAEFDNIPDRDYYAYYTSSAAYKSFPMMSGMVEPWLLRDVGGTDRTVLKRDGTFRIGDGYMPSVAINFRLTLDGQQVQVKDPKHWAFISADYMLNESEYIASLQRSNLGFSIVFAAQLKAVTEGKILNKWKPTATDQVSGGNVDTSLLFEHRGLVTDADIKCAGAIEKIVYVPSSSFTPAEEFISAISVRFKVNANIGYQVRSFVDNYFGVILTIPNATIDADGPYVEPSIGASITPQITGPNYANIGVKKKLAYLVTIYPRPNGQPIDDINQLYDTINGVAYKQIYDRMAWSQVGNTVDVYDGDCFIGKIYKKLNRSGYIDPLQPTDVVEDVAAYEEGNAEDNINQGVTFSMIHETPYNPSLRLKYLADVADPEKRSFYPYRNNGDYNKFREYRLEETNKTNLGFNDLTKPKTFVPIPDDTPFIASKYFTRLVHSEKHIPNAFQNGYRSFVGVNYQDYNAECGEIVRLFTHRDNILVVFEHGIGIGPISQRIQTGSDAAGGIFVEPSGVLPPNLSFYSKEIGVQHGRDAIQTPACIYGIDKTRRKIWQISEQLSMISDASIQSYLENLQPEAFENIRLGYDPHYHEVIFTAGLPGYEWTLCFKEGLEKFVSFYSYTPLHYARRARDFYSFSESMEQFDIHNAPVREIYGNIEDSFVEFVINPSANMTKVLDYLNLISNEVPPVKIQLYTYKIDTYKERILDVNKMFQYITIDNEIDPFTEESTIKLRDRKYVVQIPNLTYISDNDWGLGRLRNKYFIVRLTYTTDQKVELLAVVSNFRFSAS
jgi:hypothetical protein